ncbi:MAG: hypothetical protein GC136_02740 [Alphaproteobacteria bacterium]|nr:hypothetical protein [Alphaproteobacteria bacterium]
MSNIPYVVTDDLVNVFANSEGALSAVPVEAIEAASRQVTSGLQKIFPNVDRIEGGQIEAYLQDCVKNSAIPVLSLAEFLDAEDGAYPLLLSRSLITDANGDVTAALMPRWQDAGSLEVQFNNAAQLGPEVALADDVVFTGGSMLKIIESLEQLGTKVPVIYASVALEEAVAKLAERGTTVYADYIYPAVLDEICMRDFIVGAPGGGRNVIAADGSYATAPYLFPYGDIENWASIPPEFAASQSKACLEAAAQLWGAAPAKITFNALKKPVVLSNPQAEIAATMENLLKTGAYNGRAASPL